MAKKKQKKKKSNHFTGWLIILVLLIGGVYWGYSYLRSPVYQSDRAIPNDAFLVFSANNPKSFWDVLNYDNAIWKGLQKSKKIYQINKKIKTLDSLIMNDDDFWDIFEQNSCYLSLHSKNDTIHTLYIIGLGKAHQEASVTRFMNRLLSDQSSITKSTYLDFNYFTVVDRTSKFYYSVPYGIFIASESLQLLQSSLTQLENNTGLITQNDFHEIESTCGKKVDANIFIANKQLPFLSSKFSRKAPFSFLHHLNKFSLWNGMDLYVKSNACSLNGYTSISDLDMLILFQAQQPVENRGVTLLPKETKAFLQMGFSDADHFFDNVFQRYSQKETLQAINQRYGVSLINDFKAFSGEELYFAWLNNSPILLLQLSDIEKATSTFIHLSNTKQEYHAGSIADLNSSEFCNAIFGTEIFNIKPTKWCIFGDYLLLGESSETLSAILTSKNNITESKSYQNMVDNIIAFSNCSFYCDLSDNDNFFQKNCSKNLWDFYKRNREIITDFHGFYVQFSASSGLFYTNAIISYQYDLQNIIIEEEPEIQEVIAATDTINDNQQILQEEKTPENEQIVSPQPEQPDKNQKSELQGNMILKPYAVFDHTVREKKFVVFDDKNNVYLIDKNGNIVWKKQLNDQVISDVYEIDYYANGKIQYLFNSKQYLYAIDLRGNWLTGYPKKLPHGAVNSIAVFDDKQNKNYQIVFVDTKNIVQSYTKEAKPQNKWEYPTLPENTSQKAQFHSRGNEKYIILPMDNGNVLMTNQNGAFRMKIEKSFINNTNSDFYMNKTNSKGFLLTTDQQGKLIYIPEKGNVKTTVFGSFSAKHYFLYNDFNGDGSHDFIYLDGKKLTIFDRLQNQLLSYSFPSISTYKPDLFFIDNQCYISVFVASEKKVYIFSKKGLLTIVSATTPTCIVKEATTGKNIGIVGYDNKLCIFDL